MFPLSTSPQRHCLYYLLVLCLLLGAGPAFAQPAAPVVLAPANGTTMHGASPAVSGTGPASTSIEIYVDNVLQVITAADGGGNWATSIPGPLANGPHLVKALANDGVNPPSAFSASNRFTVGAAPVLTTWLGGAVSAPTDWYTEANWDNGIPTFDTDAVIPSGRPRYPVILAGHVTTHTLTLNSGTSLILNGGLLELKGDFVNNGAYNSGGGVVRLSGPVLQNVGGSRLTRIVRLEVGPAGAAMAGQGEIRQLLTLNGDLNTNGNSFLLWADFIGGLENGTATVVNNPGVVIGTVRVQRFLNGGANSGLGYRHISSPVTNTTVADLTVPNLNVPGTFSFMPVVNAAYNAIPQPIMPTASFPTVFGFNEQRGGPNAKFEVGYFSPAALEDPLVLGRGYTVKMKALTLDFVGTLHNGDLTLTGLTRTGSHLTNTTKPGWQFLGNPYCSPLDWDLVPVPTGMSRSISVFQSTGENQGVYLTRVNDGQGNGTGTLPNGWIGIAQAFFGRVTGATPVSFTFPQAARVTTFELVPHYRAAETRPLVQLTLRQAGEANEGAKGTAQIYFVDGASRQVDDAFDGTVPAHNVGVPTLLTLAGSDELTVNGLPTTDLIAGTTVELLLDLPTAGSYELGVGKLANLTNVALLDRLTRTRYDLTQQRLVTFTTAQAGEVRGRFALVFSPAGTVTGRPSLLEKAELSLSPNPAHGTVRVGGLGAASTVQLLDAVGRVVRQLAVPAGAADVTLGLTDLPLGVYVVRAGAASQRLVIGE